jgi:hypothetical protein
VGSRKSRRTWGIFIKKPFIKAELFLKSTTSMIKNYLFSDGAEDGQGPREKRGMGYHGEQVSIPIQIKILSFFKSIRKRSYIIGI